MQRLLTILLTLMALSSQAAPLELTVREGERTQIGEQGPLLQAMVLEDSRCPFDKKCLNAGQVLVVLAVTPEAGTPPTLVAVSWPAGHHAGWLARYRHPDYHFELLSLEPQACASCKRASGYTIHLRATRRKKS